MGGAREESGRLAAGYLSIGLSPGDRLASLMPNRVALAVHYLASFKPGLVATPLNYRYTASQIDHALAVSTAAALVTHVERAADVADSELAGSLPCGTVVFHDAPSWRSSPRRRESRRWDHGDGRRRDHFDQRFGIYVPSSTETASALHGASSGPFRFETSSASRSLSRIAIRKRFMNLSILPLMLASAAKTETRPSCQAVGMLKVIDIPRVDR